jgi:hypothetical protein
MISDFDAIISKLQGAAVSPGAPERCEGGRPPGRSGDRPSLMGEPRASDRAALAILEEIKYGRVQSLQ